MSEITTPKLTTTDQPVYEIGKRAASILFDEIELTKSDKPIHFQSEELETSIIERGSG